MSRTADIENFTPHYERLGLPDLAAALADLDPVQTQHGVSIALPYTERPAGGPLGGTMDTIEIGPLRRHDRLDDLHRPGLPDGFVTSSEASPRPVARCPGHMVILVVRALYAHLRAVGPEGRADTYEGDILYALGLVRPLTVDGTTYPVAQG
jgi:hypothetical protein